MEENQIGKNKSSGAQKVETIIEREADVRSGEAETERTQKKRVASKSGTSAKEQETRAAKERLAEAKKRAEQRAERRQKREAHAAEVRRRRIEKRQKQLARRELLASETQIERQKRLAREKKERAALRRQRREAQEKARAQKMQAREAAHERRAQERRKKREEDRARRKRTPGFGGWLAAVISLGAACLVLAAVVTTGAVRIKDMANERTGGYRATLYEMVSVSGEMDDNLSKLRISTGAKEQQKLLTDLIVDSALWESVLERLPVSSAAGTELSDFVNRTGNYARMLLKKVSAGETLSETEKNTIAYLEQINAALYGEMNALSTHLSRKEFTEFLAGKGGEIAQKFDQMGLATLQEPEEIVDAPFSREGNVGINRLEGMEEVSISRAEELVREYFAQENLSEIRYAGETVARNATCYNFVLTDGKSGEKFAQITKAGGKLAFFDTYERCGQKNFDLGACDALAREFLAKLGIEEVDAVWLSDGDGVADLTYVGVQNGIRVYPDMIRVRVCESKGSVIGVDAMNYWLNHAERSFGETLTREQAQEKLSAELVPYSAHLALVPIDGEEVLVHEFACNCGEEEFILYLDAYTGEEVQIYRVHDGAMGSYLK